MKTHERLLAKIKRDLPQVQHPRDPRMAQLAPVRGGDPFSRGKLNRIVHSWSNFGVAQDKVFSFHTMTECLKKPLKATYHNGVGCIAGWEIEPIEE